MFRIIARSGVVALSIAALLAVVATGAQAVEIVKAEGEGSATLSAEQTATTKITLTDNSSLSLTCTSTTLTGTLPAGGTSTPTLTPHTSGCTAFGLSATANSTPCSYTFHITGTLPGGTSWDGDVDTECEAGASSTITTLTCEIKFKAQTGLQTVVWTNSGTSQNMDVVFHLNITGKAYEVTKDGIGCPLSKVGSFSQADIAGTYTLTASRNGSPVGITIYEL